MAKCSFVFRLDQWCSSRTQHSDMSRLSQLPLVFFGVGNVTNFCDMTEGSAAISALSPYVQ
ncbi:hypothetical protein BDN70DRAFT_502720 [Pholiota conissans]|uniref:Uncharacterized protein n=1 Tax=Pholiota conissans TaxID=109636 RepID=A0A9P6CMD1_9AGAR|nr:hypothetical protein BDN70DRAFT_502720 [Pholiota conissans]